MQIIKKTGAFLLIFGLIGLLVAPLSAEEKLTLEEAYKMALENNHNLITLREQLKELDEDVTVVTSDILPQLDVSATADRRRSRQAFGDDPGRDQVVPGSATTDDSWRATATLSQPLYRAGQLLSARQIARLHREAAELDYFYETQQVLYQVASQFYGVELARKQIEIFENMKERAQTQLERSEAMYEEGMITRTPMLRARVQVAQAERELERAKNGLQLRLSELRRELGGDPIPARVEAQVETEVSLESIETYFESAQSNRRDYLGTERKLDQARQRVEMELAERYPSIDAQLTGTHYDEEVGDEDQEWMVSGTVSYPLFSGGRIEAEIRRARALHRQAEAGLGRMNEELRVQVEEAYRDVQTREKVLQALEQEVEAADENHREVTAKFEEGLSDQVEVSDAITILNEAELELASERINLKLDKLALELATGQFQESLLEQELKF